LRLRPEAWIPFLEGSLQTAVEHLGARRPRESFYETISKRFKSFQNQKVAAAVQLSQMLFAGMIDAPDRPHKRFPAACERNGYKGIRRALQQEIERTAGATIGVASAASGGDILFHEVCAELRIQVRL
jgi:hypothetical protein